MVKRYLVIPIILAGLVLAYPCSAQEKSDTQGTIPQLVPKVFSTEEGADQGKEVKNVAPSLPGLAEVVPRAADLGQKAIKDEEVINASKDTSTFEKPIAEAESQIVQLHKRVSGMGDPAKWNIYRLLDIQHSILGEKNRLGAVLDQISLKLSDLEFIRKTWEENLTYWKKWEESLREAQAEVPPETFKKAQDTANSVLQSVANASAPLLALQQKLTKLLDEVNQLNTPIDTALKKVRNETFEKNSPSFFSREFYQQFDRTLAGAIKQGLANTWQMEEEYFPHYAVMIFFQAMMTMALFSFLKRRRQLPEKTAQWRLMREHPCAFAIFAIQGLAMFFYQGAAPSWLFLNLALVVSSASVLVAERIPHPRMRRVVFFLVGVQILSSILKLISFPAPLFGLYLALLFVLGLWFFLHQAKRHIAEQDGRLDLFSIGLRGGALIVLAALLLLLSGFSNFAEYLVRSSIVTIFFIITGVILLHLGNGCIEVALSQPLCHSPRIFQSLRQCF